VAAVYRLAKGKGSGWRDLGLRPPAIGATAGLFPAVLLTYIACIAVVQVYALVLNLLGIEDLVPAQQIPDDIFDEDVVLISFAVLGVTLVPFAEELFFRGFFFAGLRKRLPFLVAAGTSGVFFSLAHADPGLIIPFTGVGVLLAYIYERTRSLYAPIGVHVLFNLVSFLILILLPEARE
jgi:membrane protease YdiL (CAAX protease family)